MTLFEYISVGMNVLLLLGIYFGYKQLVEAQKTNKAQILIKLHQEWREPEIYKSVGYIHDLRDEWKKHPVSKWDEIAKEWVEKTFRKDPEKWQARRTVSQFMGKMSYLIQTGYLKPDEFFATVPEAGRILIVLIPIELAIVKHMQKIQKAPIEEWDRPFDKWELDFLWKEYLKWYKNNAQNIKLEPINWDQLK